MLHLLVLATALPARAACVPAIALQCTEQCPTGLESALQEHGFDLSGADRGCGVARVSIQAAPTGATVQVAPPDQPASSRTLGTPTTIAAWVDSIVRVDRIADLVAAPPLPVDRTKATLYPTLEAWQQGQPSHVVSVPVLPVVEVPGITDLEGLPPFQHFDQKRAEARALGPVRLFVMADHIYIHSHNPHPTRGKEYGQAELVGHHLLYPHRDCVWVPPNEGTPGMLLCSIDVRAIDLHAGTTHTINRRWLKRTLADHPDLWDTYKSARNKDASDTWAAARAYFARVDGADGD